MSIKNNLIEEFEDEMKGLRTLQLGSEEYKATIDGVTKLEDRIIAIENHAQEASVKECARLDEEELKAAQLADDRIDKWVRNGIEFIKVGGGFALAAWAFVASMNFEKEGTVTTIMGRGFINKLLPKK